LMAAPGHTVVLLDGDKRRLQEFVDPDAIPATENLSLGDKILEATGVVPELTVDGGVNGGNVTQRVEAQRKYLAWLRANVGFIPTSCPEEFVLRAAGVADGSTTSQGHKERLLGLATDCYGPETSGERIDFYGETLLANNRATSAELAQLAGRLHEYLAAAVVGINRLTGRT